MEKYIQPILFVGAIQGILLAVVLLQVPANKKSNRILSILLVTSSLLVCLFGLQMDGFYHKYPEFLFTIDLPSITLVFPLYFLYAKYLLKRLDSFETKDILHFLPFFISIISFLKYSIMSGEDKLKLMSETPPLLSSLLTIFNEVISAQSIIYPIATLVMVANYKRSIQNQTSTLINSRIQLIQYGTVLLLFFWALSVVFHHLAFLGIEAKFDYYTFSYLALVLLIYLLSYVSLNKVEIFKAELLTSKFSMSKADAKENEAQPNREVDREKILSNERYKHLARALESAMKEQKQYLKAELNLADLAEELGTRREELSLVINCFYEKNFYEFVNEFRIEEVKRLMSDPDNKNLTMESFGYSAGFNSKASFYRIFKQFTGMSPLQFFNRKD